MNTKETPMAEGIIREGLIKLDGLNFNTKFWAKDASLWKQDKESQEFIVKFLGWQKVYNWTLERAEEILAFAADVKQNFNHVPRWGRLPAPPGKAHSGCHALRLAGRSSRHGRRRREYLLFCWRSRTYQSHCRR